MTQHRVPLLLDVDGVINVYTGPPVTPCFEVERHFATDHHGHTYELWIRPDTPSWIGELAERFEIVWCTTWRNANQAIAPLLRLPPAQRQVWFPAQWTDVPFWFCRKTPFVRRWAADQGIQRLAWIDDEITELDAEALAEPWLPGRKPAKRWEHHIAGSPAIPAQDQLLITTDPTVGLSRHLVDKLLGWHERTVDASARRKDDDD